MYFRGILFLLLQGKLRPVCLSQAPLFSWEVMPELNGDFPLNAPRDTFDTNIDISSKKLASELLGGQTMYVSLTTIHSRVYGIASTIESIIRGTVLPNHIYIFVSKEPHLLDHGVTPEFIQEETRGKLRQLSTVYPAITVVFTENIGPHRKLLPLLTKKWNEDCVIVTVDDHEIYPKHALESLIGYYISSGRDAVVALRARRMAICSNAPPWKVAPYTTKLGKGIWPEATPAHKEMLTLPTGTGGVLYRPRFFHPIVFDRDLLNITKTGDDLLFRLATLAMGVRVVTACTDVDALGNRCPPMISIKNNELPATAVVPSMTEFTFGRNYSEESLRGQLLPPAQETATSSEEAAAIAAAAAAAEEKAKKASIEREHRHREALLEKRRKENERREKNVAILSNIHMIRARERSRQLALQSAGPKQHRAAIPFILEEDIRGARSLRGNKDTNRLYYEHHRYSSRDDQNSIPQQPPPQPPQQQQQELLQNSRRRLRQATVEWKSDPRKKESLASRFNNAGGNNMMLENLIKYMYDQRVLDFDAFLQKFAPLERSQCLISASIVQPHSDSFFDSTIASVKVALQRIYDPECGVCLCDAQPSHQHQHQLLSSSKKSKSSTSSRGSINTSDIMLHQISNAGVGIAVGAGLLGGGGISAEISQHSSPTVVVGATAAAQLRAGSEPQSHPGVNSAIAPVLASGTGMGIGAGAGGALVVRPQQQSSSGNQLPLSDYSTKYPGSTYFGNTPNTGGSGSGGGIGSSGGGSRSGSGSVEATTPTTRGGGGGLWQVGPITLHTLSGPSEITTVNSISSSISNSNVPLAQGTASEAAVEAVLSQSQSQPQPSQSQVLTTSSTTSELTLTGSLTNVQLAMLHCHAQSTEAACLALRRPLQQQRQQQLLHQLSHTQGQAQTQQQQQHQQQHQHQHQESGGIRFTGNSGTEASPPFVNDPTANTNLTSESGVTTSGDAFSGSAISSTSSQSKRAKSLLQSTTHQESGNINDRNQDGSSSRGTAAGMEFTLADVAFMYFFTSAALVTLLFTSYTAYKLRRTFNTFTIRLD